MSFIKSNQQFNSPTEDIFSWMTPDNELNKKDPPSKRRCDSDSGYMSATISPASGCKSSSRNYTLITPEVSNCSNGYGLHQGEIIYTPAMKHKTDCVKKRLLQDEKSSSLTNTPEMDSFSDFMDTSLYNEPMDISIIRPNAQLGMIAEENLDLSEIGKKIALDLSMEVNSIRSEPITPMRNVMTPCDRIFRTPASLKVSHSSPRKKKILIKKKVSKPGAMIGCDHLDFFAHLGVRANFMNIAWKIIDMLSDQDMSNVSMVSKTWRNILLSNFRAKERWLRYIAERKNSKENLPRSGSGGKKKHGVSPHLGMNRNRCTPFRMKQPSSPPVSPSKFRFHLFQKEASRLKEDEKLMECPRCTLPSTVSPATRLGRCTRAGCGLEFCSSCRSPYHGLRPCTTSTPTSPQRYKRPGTKGSKRFLRRL